METLEKFLINSRYVKTTSDLCQLLQGALARLGFDYWAYTDKGGGGHRLLTNFPDQWVAHYTANNYQDIDPLVDKELSYIAPYQWSELLSRESLSKDQFQIFDEAASVGLTDGIAIPIHEINGRYASLTLGGSFDAITLNRHFLNHRTELYSLAMTFHMYSSQAAQHTRPDITERERECLKWMAQGKTSWEIGLILNISERTVNFHVSNVKKKLNATTRQQAVSSAVAQNLIRPS